MDEEDLNNLVKSYSEGRYETFENLIQDFCASTDPESADWTDTSDNYNPVPNPEFLDTEDEILYHVAKGKGEMRVKGKIDDLSVKNSRAQEVVNKLSRNGYLNEIQNSPKIVSITTQGFQRLLSTPLLEMAETSSNTDEKVIQRVHNITVRYRVPEAASFSNEWRREIFEASKREWEYQEDKNTYFGYFSNITVEMMPDTIDFHISKSYNGYSRARLFNEAIGDAVDLLQEIENRYLEKEEHLYLEEHISEFEVVQVEIAVANHPSAVLIAETQNALEKVDLRDLRHKTEEGEMFWVDESGGIAELEGSGQGIKERFDGFWKLTKDQLLNSEKYRKTPERVNEHEEKIQEQSRSIEENREILQAIQSILNYKL